MFSSFTPCLGYVNTAGDCKLRIKAKGEVELMLNGIKVILHDVLYVPEANSNLISVYMLLKDGARVTFNLTKAIITWPNKSKTTASFNPRCKQWEIHRNQTSALLTNIDEIIKDLPEHFDAIAPPRKPDKRPQAKWHERLGHPGQNKSSIIKKLYGVNAEPNHSLTCHDCLATKSTKVSRTGPTVGNDDEGEIERSGDYQTSEGVDERVDCES